MDLTQFKGRRGPRGMKKFAFTYQDISDLTGISLGNLRIMAHRGQFDPSNLQSLVDFVVKRQKKCNQLPENALKWLKIGRKVENFTKKDKK